MPQNNAIVLTDLETEYEIQDASVLESNEYASYVEGLKQLNILPFSKGAVYYSDDVWDFSSFTTLNVRKSDLKINFKNCPETFRDDLKNYTLLKILENKVKIQTIEDQADTLCRFFSFMSQNHIYSVEDITQASVKDFLQSIRESKSPVTLRKYKSTLRSFYLQYSINFQNIATPAILDLFKNDNYKAFKAYKEQNRSKDIPNQYFDKVRLALLKIMEDESVSSDIRSTACLYMILSQTGLRAGELLGLYPDSLKTTKIFNGEEAYYLEYRTWKREHLNNKTTTSKTAINKLAKQAFDLLIQLGKDKREQLQQPYLYMGSSRYKKEKNFPLSTEDFKKDAFDLMVALDDQHYLETINLSEEQYPDIHRYKTKKDQTSLVPYKRTGRDPVKTLTFPDTQQFRFHCCTDLYNKGIPLEYIKRFMSHLTTEMISYHIYPEKSPQENMDYAVAVLKEIITGDVRPLGADKGLVDRIQKFINDNGFHIENDLETISEQLALKIPIRQKTGGVCIKSSQLRDCNLDSETNEFYCAYGVCPNIFHFYYMADVSYRQCKELEDIIGINAIREKQFYAERGKKIGKAEKLAYPKQKQKHMNMLYTMTTKRLEPEIEDLERVVNEKGVEEVFYSHPNLKEIVENLDQIKEEIGTWKSLKL